MHANSTVSLPIVPREVETRDLADAVSRTRVEPRGLDLGSLGHFAEHLAGSGEIETAMWRGILDRGKHEMRTVDIAVQGGELVVERVTDEALCREMITLVGLHPAHNLMQARKALERTGVQHDLVPDGRKAQQSVLVILQGDAPHNAMDFVPL